MARLTATRVRAASARGQVLPWWARWQIVAALIAAVTVVGTVGYTLIEGWTLWDSFYMTLITITTVGYGDRFPVTLLGRLVGLFVMLTGVGIIAALASILASLLVPPPAPEEGTTPANTEAGVDAARLADELASLRAEVTALRAEIRR